MIITFPGVVLLFIWVASMGVVAIVVHHITERRVRARALREGAQIGFLDGVRSERRFHEGDV